MVKTYEPRKGPMSDPVDWSTIPEQRFNEVVEALLVAEYSRDGLRARAINGRGGDQGVDVGVWSGSADIVRIFQLKHYRDGWSTKQSQRRRHIRESFQRAVSAHRLSQWTLVTASNPSMSERQFVLDLKGDYDVEVDLFGPAELDALLGLHPHVFDRFFADRALQLLTAINRPEELLRKPGDLGVVMRRIHERLQIRSDWWGTRTVLHPDGSIEETVVALTPDSAEQEPLTLSVITQFSPEHQRLREEFTRSLKYGFAETLTLPSEVIRSIVRDGPEWWAAEDTGGTLQIGPASGGAGLPATLTSYDSHGTRTGSIEGTVRRADKGSVGLTIVADMAGGLAMTWRLPDDHRATGEVSSTVASAGHRVRDVRRLSKFLVGMDKAVDISLKIGEHPPVGLRTSKPDNIAPPAHYVQMLDDLVAIEDLLDIALRLPVERDITADERVWARVILKVLQGVAVPFPGIDGFSFTLTGERGSIEDRLEEGAAAILVERQEFAVELLDTEIHLGPVFIFHSRAEFQDSATHLVALREGSGHGRTVQVRGQNGLPFTLYAPGRLSKRAKYVKTVGWGIDGVAEHPKLKDLLKLQSTDRATSKRATVMRLKGESDGSTGPVA